MEIILSVPRDARSKILSQDEAAERVRQWQDQTRRTVFTNGCFDIIHKGHSRYLAEARHLGDALIVGVNSDDSIRRLKGKNRPIMPELARAEVVASLECVDLVVVFPEDTPAELIAAIKPNVLAKGADWPVDQVVGKDTVEAAGGSVVSVPLVEGQSTSKIIETILSRYGFSKGKTQ